MFQSQIVKEWNVRGKGKGKGKGVKNISISSAIKFQNIFQSFFITKIQNNHTLALLLIFISCTLVDLGGFAT
jgi:hypothetical protein